MDRSAPPCCSFWQENHHCPAGQISHLYPPRSLPKELLLSLCGYDSLGHSTLKGEAASQLVWGKGGKRQFEGGAATLTLTKMCDLLMDF